LDRRAADTKSREELFQKDALLAYLHRWEII